MKKFNTYKLVVTAMLSAAAFLLMYIEVPIPSLIPGFVKMDISDLPGLLGAFALGPVPGVVISLLKNVLHGLIKGTSTGWIGELCNFLLAAAFTFTAGLIYMIRHNKKAAIIGSLIASVVMGLASVPVNYFISYPLYANLFGGMDNIIAAYMAILPSADTLIKCLVIFNLPFTIVKGLLCSVICFLIYKPLSPVLHGKNG
ncbi:MAG: ECF transporter S component [Lachnospiraceae bacterium]|nr:ECF transporter S component [Lachnospiraceae bacterium]